MAVRTTILKEPKISLPRSWRGAEVLVRTEGDTLVVKRILGAQEPIFDDASLRALRKLGRRIPQKAIRAAVRWARRRP